jgi:predicted nucleic acid-binding protein
LSYGELSLGLLDTSVFIATENGRPLRLQALPERSFISIVTKAELRAGVLAADDIETRDQRLDTLERIASLTVIPIGEGVDRIWAGMRAYLGAAGQGGQRINANDLWIAATAAAHELPVVTQDRDFHALSGVNGLTVIEV